MTMRLGSSYLPTRIGENKSILRGLPVASNGAQLSPRRCSGTWVARRRIAAGNSGGGGAVPEPGTLSLFVLALGVLGCAFRRRSAKRN